VFLVMSASYIGIRAFEQNPMLQSCSGIDEITGDEVWAVAHT
jgi:hypothetical protein